MVGPGGRGKGRSNENHPGGFVDVHVVRGGRAAACCARQHARAVGPGSKDFTKSMSLTYLLLGRGLLGAGRGDSLGGTNRALVQGSGDHAGADEGGHGEHCANR